MLISSKGYGLMWSTAALTYFDNRFPLEMKLTSIADKSIDYYFLYGPEIDALLHGYRTSTGHTPMLPKWAYGFFQSKDRYVSFDQIREIAERYRREHIPLDAMVHCDISMLHMQRILRSNDASNSVSALDDPCNRFW